MRTGFTKLQARQQALTGRVGSTSLGAFLLVLGHEIADDDLMGLAAEMAYRFLFALFPLLLFMAASLGFVGEAVGLDDILSELLEQSEPLLPPEVYSMLERYVQGLLQEQSPSFLAIGILGTLWGAAGGVGTLIKALNRAYDVERPRPLWRRQLLALIVVALLPPAAMSFFIVAVLGRVIAEALTNLFRIGPAVSLAFTYGRWPVLMVLLLLGLSLLYHVLPHVNHQYRWSLPGSAFATMSWTIVTFAFSVYLANFNNYDVTYGSFGTVMIFMLWLYLVSVVMLIGAEINSLLEPQQRISKIQERRRQLRRDE